MFKNVGWRGESWRHYMAAKGVKTTSTRNQYFVLNELKGNRTSSNLHRAHSKGFSKSDLLQDESARQAFGVSIEEIRGSRRSSFPEDLSRSEEVVSAPMISEGEPLPETTKTTPESMSVGGGAGASFGLMEDTTVMSPGVPPPPPSPDNAFFKKKVSK